MTRQQRFLKLCRELQAANRDPDHPQRYDKATNDLSWFMFVNQHRTTVASDSPKAKKKRRRGPGDGR